VLKASSRRRARSPRFGPGRVVIWMSGGWGGGLGRRAGRGAERQRGEWGGRGKRKSRGKVWKWQNEGEELMRYQRGHGWGVVDYLV
jgi:hypothetical protein